jgi:thioredoxin
MKIYRTSFSLLAVFALCGLSSCDKARTLAKQLGKKEEPIPAATPHSGALVSEISQGSYNTFPMQRGRVVIVDFHAEWCGPCRQLGPILEKIANEKQGLVLVGKVNVDHNKQLAADEGVRGIPDVRIYRDGKLVDKFVGLPSESDVRQRIESQLKGLPPVAPAAAESTKSKTAEPVTTPMSKDWLPNGMKRR